MLELRARWIKYSSNVSNFGARSGERIYALSPDLAPQLILVSPQFQLTGGGVGGIILRMSISINNMRTEPHRIFRQALEKKDLKYTKQRRVILDYLLKTTKHLTPEEIYRDLNRNDPALGRATVFRTLHLLEDCGFVGKISFPDGRQGYENKYLKPHHDHMICTECNEVIEFSSSDIERIQNEITSSFHFTPLRHKHEIFGRCRKCQEKRK